MKTLSIFDLPLPKVKEDLIGRIYTCVFEGCDCREHIGSDGIEHFGYRHYQRYSLQELFDMVLWDHKTSMQLLFSEK